MFVLAALPAQQPGAIRGVVTDRDFAAPLAGVTVSAAGPGSELKAVTGELGNYVLREVPPGTYTLMFSKDGYVRQVRSNVVVAAGQLTEVAVALSGDFTDMEEFVVEDVLQLGGGSEAGLLQLRFDSPSMMDSISADLMSRAGASDAASALRLVAGASLQDGKSAVIRGLPDRYVSSQMNGVRLPTADEDKRAVELDQFPSSVIESIQVSKSFTPDQQGDASGGAVDVRLKGVPDEPLFLSWKVQVGKNTDVSGRGDFLSYQGGGLHFFGKGGGERGNQQLDPLVGQEWGGAVGVREQEAPIDYKWSGSGGGRFEVADGVAVGGFVSVFYERDSSHDEGFEDSLWLEAPGAPMTPNPSQGSVASRDFVTSLLDVRRSSQSAQWGGLATFGVETEHHELTLAYLFTRSAEDEATLAEDTRGKEYFYPGHDPANPTTPGHALPDLDAAPYVRFETLQYTERATDTLQLHGRHTLPNPGAGPFRAPKLDWTLSQSAANSDQPDKRQFGSKWRPIGGGEYEALKPSATLALGNVQRIFKTIDEDSDQYSVNLELPFEQWSGVEGYLKFGVFHDEVERRFNQDSFSNSADPNNFFSAPFEVFWSSQFPLQGHDFIGSTFDVDYLGRQKLRAHYAMVDLPLSSWANLIGGIRFESKRLSVENFPGPDAQFLPDGGSNPVLVVDEIDQANFSRVERDDLPALGLVADVGGGVTLRASYAETVARQTFKEVTPILQQEFLGGPLFIGNPGLRQSQIANYDLRVDWAPYEGGLFSVSWFEKDIDDPIEYVQRPGVFDFTGADNFPKGKLTGWELETRHALGEFWSPLDGLSVGANATLIDAKVDMDPELLQDIRTAGFDVPGERDMTDAPDYLYNLFATWDAPEAIGTRVGVFYTFQGDTLVAGAGIDGGNFVPDLYTREYGTLNLSVSQQLGESTTLAFAAKNLTDPDIEQIYRSPAIGADVTRASFTKGIDYSVSIGGRIKF
ncbi:MAG: TonB-dependent receptor [Planctomycetota bacterium]